MENSYIVIGAVVIGYLLYKKFAFIGNKNVKNVSAEEAYDLIKNNNGVLILDVRTPSEFSSGHIPGAKSLPVATLESGLNQLDRYKDKPVIVHCASGGRSPAAVKLLLKNGFQYIYHMNHGLTDWKYGLK